MIRLSSLLVAVLTAACNTEPPERIFQGYAEGEYVRVASPYAGRLISLKVARGAEVAAGTPLFSLEQENEAAARREVAARLERAEAQLEDLTKSRRPPEIRTATAELQQAQASVKMSEALMRRRHELVAANAVSKQEFDEARAAYERDRARVTELSARLATTRLAAREDEVLAQRAEVAAQRAALAQADWRLEQKSVGSPVTGPVVDTLYTQGEWVPAGSPVVSLLPPQNIKLKFFVPERVLATVRVGDQIGITCDGCPNGLTATINFVSPQAEFTPPVIYSQESRSKLVFLIEAKPANPAAFHPGQPIDVRLP